MSRHALLLVLSLTVVLGMGCVSRNVEPIEEEEAATLVPPDDPIDPATTTDDPAAAAELSGTIEVAAELADRVPSDAVLYLIVRVAGREGGAPLRVRRMDGQVPARFVITESDSMVPGTPLVDEMILSARLDQDGDAFTETPGDLAGELGPIGPGASDLTLVLDTRVTEATGR